MSRAPIPFVDLHLTEDRMAVTEAINRVVARGWFVLGPEVEAFEREFADACGAAESVGVGTGTDAIALILRAIGIGPGDEVITTPVSAAYTALAVMMVGATPVFADIDPLRLTLDPAAAAAAVTSRTRALLPVHLYGQPADMPAFEALASRFGLALVEDCAQAHLATSQGRPVGTIGVAGAYSFYPTKNLGALGDGGAMATNDRQLADRVRRLRNGGQTSRYHHAEFGVNSRLDELQAAILRERLKFLPGWIETRRRLARRYRMPLAASKAMTVPPELEPGHVYHLFPVLCPDRDAFQAHMAADGIQTLIHYPIAIPRQPALGAFEPASCPVAERVCSQVCSLPLHPALADEFVDRIAGRAVQFPAGPDDGPASRLDTERANRT
ncbi:MAG: DegT/DnrJ/EryC1/StrS family aminotransferase [Vicinamibacterales bacterium]